MSLALTVQARKRGLLCVRAWLNGFAQVRISADQYLADIPGVGTVLVTDNRKHLVVQTDAADFRAANDVREWFTEQMGSVERQAHVRLRVGALWEHTRAQSIPDVQTNNSFVK